MEFTVGQLAAMLEGRVEGDPEIRITTLTKIQDGKEGAISFLSNPKYEKHIYETHASAVIVADSFEPREAIHTTLIYVKDPYISFTLLLEEYHKFLQYSKEGIEQPSFCDESASIGDHVYRGAFSYVGAGTTIGENVKIYPQVFIGDNVRIGNNTILHPGAKVYANTVVGNNCVIHSGVVLGSSGFGYAPQEDGSYKNIPQLGNVVLDDFVHVGSNATIDCATMQGDSTIIGEGTKLDNLVQLGHNVAVGKHTVIAAQTGVSGSTSIGDYCVIGGQVGFAGHIQIANKTSIGAQSGVLKDTREGEKLMGTFAIDLRSYLSSYAVFKKLPELNRRLKELEEKILNLPTV